MCDPWIISISNTWDLLEMWILRSHPRPTASEMMETQQSMFSQALLQVLMHTQGRKPLPSPLGLYFNAVPQMIPSSLYLDEKQSKKQLNHIPPAVFILS